MLRGEYHEGRAEESIRAGGKHANGVALFTLHNRGIETPAANDGRIRAGRG